MQLYVSSNESAGNMLILPACRTMFTTNNHRFIGFSRKLLPFTTRVGGMTTQFVMHPRRIVPLEMVGFAASIVAT